MRRGSQHGSLGQVALSHPAAQARRPGLRVPAGENPNEWQGFHRDGRRYTPDEWPLARAVQTGEAVTGEEIDYLRDDGSRGTVSVNAAPVRDSAGVVVAGVAIFTDVTERKTLEQEKEALLAAITHDLRSPLTVVRGVASLLRREAGRGAIPKERLIARLLGIEDAADRMARQLSELQDIAQLRTGQALHLQRRVIDLVTLVQDGAARYQAISQDHQISVVLAGLDQPELRGEWDEDRLGRVLDNLVGNALKFSPAGGAITLTLSSEPAELGALDRPVAVLRMSDEGIGIPADDLPHVFDWFRRASNVAGKIAGTGIGLAAARQIVELHGGTIGVDSPAGGGATFTVRLPLLSASSTSG